MQIGIIGLPFSGKTTFFQTLTESHLDLHAMQKKEANQAIVKIPDKRLDYFTDVFQPKKKVNATIDIVDIAGVQKGDHNSSSFNSNFIQKIRNTDALIHVVRGFDDDALPHPEGSIDLVRDIKMLDEELVLTDMAFVESRLDKLEKDIMKAKIKDQAIKEQDTMKKWMNALENNIPIRELETDAEEEKLIRNYQPLTAKPVLIALNLNEGDIASSSKIVDDVKSRLNMMNVRIEPFFAKIEMELVQLSEEEKEMFMAEYGIAESALTRLIRTAYDLLGLQSFFTVGEDECRAWTIKKGMTAQESAGVIHTDFYQKFIRAEVVGYNDFNECGTFAKCKEKGVFRLEGKEYVVKDGDILHVRHG